MKFNADTSMRERKVRLYRCSEERETVFSYVSPILRIYRRVYITNPSRCNITGEIYIAMFYTHKYTYASSSGKKFGKALHYTTYLHTQKDTYSLLSKLSIITIPVLMRNAAVYMNYTRRWQVRCRRAHAHFESSPELLSLEIRRDVQHTHTHIPVYKYGSNFSLYVYIYGVCGIVRRREKKEKNRASYIRRKVTCASAITPCSMKSQ